MGFLWAGVLTGILSGLLGIGGATIAIPLLVFVSGMTQHEAQGTFLAAMVPPVALLAAWRYHQLGYVKLVPAAWIAAGCFVGGYLGALLVQYIPDLVLKRIFGAYLLVIAVRMVLSK